MDLEGKARNSQVRSQLQESERVKMPGLRALTMKNMQQKQNIKQTLYARISNHIRAGL